MTLIVEFGTGKTYAESYASVEYADAYFESHPNDSWAGNETMKEQALRQATQFIDSKYGPRWKGRRYLSTQRLDWPRVNVEADGWTLDYSVLPHELPDATCEAAVRWLVLSAAGSSLAPDITEPGAIAGESVTVGPITTSKTYAGGRSQSTWFRILDLLLGRLLRGRQMERA